MRLRTLEILQWAGLLVGGVVWTAVHVVGYGVTEAACGRGGVQWGIDTDLWEALLMGVAAALVFMAAMAAVAVVYETRGGSYESPPPPGRVRFFAIAAVAANFMFFMIVVLDGLGAIFNVACRQA
jgi:hypothetical protein